MVDNKKGAKGLLNTANYRLGGTLPGNAISIGLFKEDQNGVAEDTAVKGKDGKVDPANDPNKLRGIAAQQIQATVSKGVKPVYEIGTYDYYIIDGRPQGQGQISYLFGPSGLIIDRIKTFADICAPCTLRVHHDGINECYQGQSGHTGSKQTMEFKSGTLTSLSIQATSQDFMVVGSIGFIFMDVQGEVK